MKFHLIDKGGGLRYRRVSLYVNKRGIARPVHFFVNSAFHGARPPGHHVRHLDGDSLNNCASNLAWGTTSENTLDRVRHGTHNETRKTHCPQGHEYTDENTYRSRKGHRTCVTCKLAANRRRKRQRRLEQAERNAA